MGTRFERPRVGAIPSMALHGTPRGMEVREQIAGKPAWTSTLNKPFQCRSCAPPSTDCGGGARRSTQKRDVGAIDGAMLSRVGAATSTFR